jgi:hypothetical protein
MNNSIVAFCFEKISRKIQLFPITIHLEIADLPFPVNLSSNSKVILFVFLIWILLTGLSKTQVRADQNKKSPSIFLIDLSFQFLAKKTNIKMRKEREG